MSHKKCPWSPHNLDSLTRYIEVAGSPARRQSVLCVVNETAAGTNTAPFGTPCLSYAHGTMWQWWVPECLARSGNQAFSSWIGHWAGKSVFDFWILCAPYTFPPFFNSPRVFFRFNKYGFFTFLLLFKKNTKDPKNIFEGHWMKGFVFGGFPWAKTSYGWILER